MDEIRLFLSYSSKDSLFQDRIKSELDRLGISAWRDLNHLRGGDKWWPEIKKAINQCNAVILTLSDNSLASEYVQKELQEAQRLDRKIIPLLIADLKKDSQEWLNKTQWIKQFTSNFDEGVKHLLLALWKVGIRSELPLPERYKNYLKHKISELSSWKKRYTPLFVKFEQLTIFAQLRSIHKGTGPNTLLDIVANNDKIVILGAAGSGKTTTLQKVTLDAANKSIADLSNQSIPIYVELRDYGPLDLESLVQNSLKPWGIVFSDIEPDLGQGRFLLVMDGLNEVSVSSQEDCQKEIRAFLRNYPRNSFIITSRTIGYKDSFLAQPENPLPTCEILDLTREQISEYIQRYFNSLEEIAEKLISALQLQDDAVWRSTRSLARLATVPLLLQMLILTFAQIKRIPRNEGQLLLDFVNEILLRETGKSAAKYKNETKKALLATVAWEMSEQYSLGVTKPYIWKKLALRISELRKISLAKKGDELEEIWEELQNNHLIIDTGETVYFPHPLYQELFYGLSLRDACFSDLWEPHFGELYYRFRPISAKRAGSRYFDSGIRMLEIVPSPYRASALAAVSCINPSLSHRAYLNMEPEYAHTLRGDFLSELLQMALSRELSEGEYYENLAKSIGRLEGDDICDPLKDIASKSPHRKGRQWAAITLWNKCYPDESNDTLSFLQKVASEDNDHFVRAEVLSLISRLKNMSDSIILFFVDRLLNESLHVAQPLRLKIETILKNEIAIDKLVKIAKNKDAEDTKRARAIWIIAKTFRGNANKRDLLAVIAKHPDKDSIRISAISGLRNFCSKSTMKVFRQLLSDDSVPIRRETVRSLRACQMHNTTVHLITALSDSDEIVCEEAILGLVETSGKKGALDNLFENLNSNEERARRNAFDATARIAIMATKDNGKKAAKELVAFQNHPDPYVRLHVASGIRNYDTSTSSTILHGLLSEENLVIKEAAEKLANELGMLNGY